MTLEERRGSNQSQRDSMAERDMYFMHLYVQKPLDEANIGCPSWKDNKKKSRAKINSDDSAIRKTTQTVYHYQAQI